MFKSVNTRGTFNETYLRGEAASVEAEKFSVEKDGLEVQHRNTVLLLQASGVSTGQLSRSGGGRTFSSRSSILRSISRMAFSRPLLQWEGTSQ